MTKRMAPRKPLERTVGLGYGQRGTDCSWAWSHHYISNVVGKRNPITHAVSQNTVAALNTDTQ
jgi:hypothetical protein